MPVISLDRAIPFVEVGESHDAIGITSRVLPGMDRENMIQRLFVSVHGVVVGSESQIQGGLIAESGLVQQIAEARVPFSGRPMD